MEALITTIINRPYVVAFLVTFLVIGILDMGLQKTLIWLVIGYVIAFISEYLSINYGIPYGDYKYLYDAFEGELVFFGVPVWDSISYSFLSYASFIMAKFFIHPIKHNLRFGYHVKLLHPATTILFAALLTTMLDVIIDPVANLGEKWFLGKIYYYPNGGVYFGVPISNYLGWFIVSLCIIAAFYVVDRFVCTPECWHETGAKRFNGQALLGPLFYFGIALFNIFIAFYIKETLLGLVSSMILLPIIGFTAIRIVNREKAD